MFMFEAQPLDQPAEAFPRPHLLIMKQYLSSSFSWEEILSCSCLWTPLVSVINGFPITHCSCLPLSDAPNPAALPDSSGSGALGLGFSISACSQCHFCPSNTANLFQQTRHWAHPLLGKLTWGWHWHFVGHKRGSGVSRRLPWVLMASKVPSHQNLVMRDKICCSESVEHVRSGMNWDFPQRTSIAQNQFWEVSSHCLRTPWLLKI